MPKLFGVMAFHRSIVNWSLGVDVSSVYVHSAICQKLFGVMAFHRSIVNWSGGRCILSICAFCYMPKLFGVMAFHRSIVNWSLGVDVSSVYVHSAICETYLL